MAKWPRREGGVSDCWSPAAPQHVDQAAGGEAGGREGQAGCSGRLKKRCIASSGRWAWRVAVWRTFAYPFLYVFMRERNGM